MSQLNTVELIGMIQAYEMGELGDGQIVLLFQALVDSGLAWTLQGHYGRTATSMIEQGLIIPMYNQSKKPLAI